MKPYFDGRKYGLRFRFDPRHIGATVKVPRCVRSQCVGGVIYKGKLEVCDYRKRPGLDRSRLMRKHMGNRLELLKSRFGWRETEVLMLEFERATQSAPSSREG